MFLMLLYCLVLLHGIILVLFLGLPCVCFNIVYLVLYFFLAGGGVEFVSRSLKLYNGGFCLKKKH